jgi:hypothetical protein
LSHRWNVLMAKGQCKHAAIELFVFLANDTQQNMF